MQRLLTPEILLSFSDLFANSVHLFANVVYIQHHFHHADLLIIYRLIDLLFDLRLAYVVTWEFQRNPCQTPCKCRISESYCLCSEAACLSFCSAYEYYQIICSVLIVELFYSLLILQIHGSGSRSDEALGRAEYDLGSC